jgi:hypothetical protein
VVRRRDDGAEEGLRRVGPCFASASPVRRLGNELWRMSLADAAFVPLFPLLRDRRRGIAARTSLVPPPLQAFAACSDALGASHGPLSAGADLGAAMLEGAVGGTSTGFVPFLELEICASWTSNSEHRSERATFWSRMARRFS